MPGKKSIAPVVILMVTTVSACTDRPTAPAERRAGNLDVVVSSDASPQTVRELAAARGIVPLPPKPKVRRSLVLLGQALAFDKVLSGNRDISCMTCHLPQLQQGRRV